MVIKNIRDTIVFCEVDFDRIRERVYKNLNNIVSHTINTWQLHREEEEKYQDTYQGKIAEYFVEYFLNEQLKLKYIPYDIFRKDCFKKHAPFDGILVNNDLSELKLDKFINMINHEIFNNTSGQISVKLHNMLIKNGIYTVEIKSTKVTERHRIYGNTYEAIIDSIINNDDYLEYPNYCRSSNSISNLKDYIKYLESKFKSKINLKKLKGLELPFMKFFYIRVYIDFEKNTVYLIGFITRDKFFENKPQIKKMIKKGKSENAIYFVKPIKEVNIPIFEINKFLRGY